MSQFEKEKNEGKISESNPKDTYNNITFVTKL